ncbi:MAG: retropepsin-like aspartic protease [Rubrivivax sp.]|nr:retropepsin-like aspartic protease [Rubrivivax sp.]
MNELPGWVKHSTVWLLLAVGLFMGVQAWMAREAATRFVVDGAVVEIRRAADGHYHWPGRISGRSVDFLVDTGASGTAIPEALASDLGLPALGRVRSQTAGGVVTGTVVVGDLELQGGVKAERLRMVAMPGLAAPLLGMDVLSRLRWQQGDGTLRIDLHGAAR